MDSTKHVNFDLEKKAVNTSFESQFYEFCKLKLFHLGVTVCLKVKNFRAKIYIKSEGKFLKNLCQSGLISALLSKQIFSS